ncbi:hypothetical protein FVR03_21150 [Pontibacter qinzhouensis]|uniref:Uncharacterized protein n=1 Tax=Pontibacter qinzhouensis TaxID=2603253 RepID=A0A5C8IZY9_9BACT|nr:hypothetical protein [Pontibacter qinzhouensis]TXK27404.1 hypothetical protein FVR03_21150 [Pontibacter qinzhouensis]
MNKDKTLEEAVLRANLSTAQETQQQEHLINMANLDQNHRYDAKAPVNESHVNLMQAWQNLRGMDSELLQKNRLSGI